jgi:CheY-like chemotaxis protein
MPERAVILLAEDNEDHVLLIRRAFKHAGLVNPLFVVHDGAEAIQYLAGVGRYGQRAEFPLPDLLLLDLKMPRKNGFEVLDWIRSHAGLRALRVVVLTTSSELNDVNRAYQLGANSFLVKPTDFESVTNLLEQVKNYWMWADKAPDLKRSTIEQTFPPPSEPPEGTQEASER